jgi:squalene-hopene/tetraprenyl-beta-curcumene cyclase
MFTDICPHCGGALTECEIAGNRCSQCHKTLPPALAELQASRVGPASPVALAKQAVQHGEGVIQSLRAPLKLLANHYLIVGTLVLIVGLAGYIVYRFRKEFADVPIAKLDIWKPDEAAKYMDERQQAWFASAKCVSCHTGLPYALARAALRKSASAKEPSEQERNLLDQTRLRVANWRNLDTQDFPLYYDSNDDLKTQSWGTEAVFNAAILAFNDRYEGRSSPSEATEQAFANLWATQVKGGDDKGTWDWLDFNEAPWGNKEARYVGAALAAIAIGTAPGYYTSGGDRDTDARVELLQSYLKDQLTKQTLHNRAWGLWAATQVSGILTPAEQKKVIDDLLDKQQTDGGWNLTSLGPWVRTDKTAQETRSDGYATALVLHVLQTARVGKDNAKVARGLAWLKCNQAVTGAWISVSVVKKRDPASHRGKFMSDAATAFAVLALGH